MKQLLSRILPPVVVLIVALLTWEGLVRWRIHAAPPGEYLLPLPSPIGIYHAFADHGSDMFAACWVTAQGALLGFIASASVGTLIAICLAASPLIRRAFYPYTLFFQTVPIVAIAPMLQVWSGAGLRAVAIVAFIVSVFPVIASTLAGLVSTDPALLDLFRLYRAGPIARLWKLRLPWALPQLLTGLRVAAGLSVIGTVVAEFFVGTYGPGEGLGVQLVLFAKYAQVDAVFAGVLLASGLGLALFGCVNLASLLLLRRWHPSER